MNKREYVKMENRKRRKSELLSSLFFPVWSQSRVLSQLTTRPSRVFGTGDGLCLLFIVAYFVSAFSFDKSFVLIPFPSALVFTVPKSTVYLNAGFVKSKRERE